jgi:hypothetical protein
MPNLRARKTNTNTQRLPLTIALNPATYSFVESCARQKQFRSLDDFFEAALSVFRHHMDALNAYVELEEAKGRTFDEIMRGAQCEIVFTVPRD